MAILVDRRQLWHVLTNGSERLLGASGPVRELPWALLTMADPRRAARPAGRSSGAFAAAAR